MSPLRKWRPSSSWFLSKSGLGGSKAVGKPSVYSYLRGDFPPTARQTTVDIICVHIISTAVCRASTPCHILASIISLRATCPIPCLPSETHHSPGQPTSSLHICAPWCNAPNTTTTNIATLTTTTNPASAPAALLYSLYLVDRIACVFDTTEHLLWILVWCRSLSTRQLFSLRPEKLDILTQI